MHGSVRGCSTPQKSQSEKNQGKKKINKTKKFEEHYHNAVYKWVKSGEFLSVACFGGHYFGIVFPI